MKKHKNSNYKYGTQQPQQEKPPVMQALKEKLLWFGTQTGLFALRVAILFAVFFLVFLRYC